MCLLESELMIQDGNELATHETSPELTNLEMEEKGSVVQIVERAR